MRTSALVFPAALVAAGPLTGDEVGALVAVHPALTRVPVPGGLLAEQAPDALAAGREELPCRAG